MAPATNQRWPKVNNPWDVSNVSQLRGKRWERAMHGVENYVKSTQCRRYALPGKHVNGRAAFQARQSQSVVKNFQSWRVPKDGEYSKILLHSAVRTVGCLQKFDKKKNIRIFATMLFPATVRQPSGTLSRRLSPSTIRISAALIHRVPAFSNIARFLIQRLWSRGSYDIIRRRGSRPLPLAEADFISNRCRGEGRLR